jgi:hypothetical protein
MQWAAGERRAIITHDSDFIALGSAMPRHAGVGYCHQFKYSSQIGALLGRLMSLHEDLTSEDWTEQVIFL